MMLGGLDSTVFALQQAGLGFMVLADVVLAVMSLYLLLLAVASFFAGGNVGVHNNRSTSFAVLIPAHNEELLLGKLLECLQKLDYPAELYDVHVVADNCSDRTAVVAASAGVHVHERFDSSARGKGYALNWLVDRLLAITPPVRVYDAFVILDADSTVPADFLTEMAASLSAGNLVVQGFNDVANPIESWTTSLRYVAFCLICYLRPLGRSALGLSTGLGGNGMCLSRSVLQQFKWDPQAMAEDHELHFRLLESGLKVTFAARAHVYSQIPTSLRSSHTQNVRWEQGKVEVMVRYSLRLFLTGVRTRNWSMLNAAFEMTIPPFSLAFAAAFAALGLGLLVSAPIAAGLGAISVCAQLLYTLRGLAIMPVQSPRIYLALVYAPLFILWKARIYLGLALGNRSREWVRTPRTEAD